MCLERPVRSCASPRHCSFPPPCLAVNVPGQHPRAGPNPAHTSPATALTGEDEEPETCLQRGAQHGGLCGSVTESCQEQSEMSAALPAEEGSLSHLRQGGSPSPHSSPGLLSPPQKPPVSFQLSAFPSRWGGWFSLTLDLQKELFPRHLPLVNRDFAGGSSSCVNSCSSLLEMPLPPLQSPAFLPPSALLLAFFPFSFSSLSPSEIKLARKQISLQPSHIFCSFQ